MATSPSINFPNESPEYRSARDHLLQHEAALRAQIESVAELRRRLPPGGEVATDYEFEEWDDDRGDAHRVRLSQLFEATKDSLFLYSFMFIPDGEGNPLGVACPSCTSIIDAVSWQAQHVTQRVNLAVSTKAPIEAFRRHAANRRWGPIRLLSSAPSTYNRDYHAEAEDGAQLPMATVFVRRGERIHHSWSTELRLLPFERGEYRHVDFMWPLWNIFDCTPDGRSTDWHPSLRYE